MSQETAFPRSDDSHPSRQLFIASNRLPVHIQKSSDEGIDVSLSSGGLVAGLREIHKNVPFNWLGYGAFPDLNKDQHSDLLEKLRSQRLIPVDIEEKQYKKYYRGMSNQTIWPLFHYFISEFQFSLANWTAYEQVNQQFAEEICKLANDDDMVWVHDYHLMLLPKFLKKLNPSLSIAYFHHIPFPSSDIFRILPSRVSILEGLLECDLIGFHSFDFARHFLSSVARVLGHDIVVDDIYQKHRITKVGVFPLGPNFKTISEHVQKLNESGQHSKMTDAIGTEYLFLGVDRLDYTKGIPERILAFREFLKGHPEFCGKVSLVQLCVPTRANIKAYDTLKSEVERLVSEVNGTFGRPGYTPIHYLYQNLPMDEVIALYKAADVAIVTPLRDGMNLVAKEFVASRDDKKGVLILSEFAGASVEMGEALWVNPYDIRDMAKKMFLGLTMPEKEQQKRMLVLRERARLNDNIVWSKNFMETWNKTSDLNRNRTSPLTGGRRSEIIEEIIKGKKIFIFSDNDGTLTPIRQSPEQAIPEEKTRQLISRIGRYPDVVFTLVTGRPREYCDTYFKDLPINIFAEHGSFFKDPLNPSWKSMLSPDEFATLKDEILPLIQSFVKTVPGSHIELKSTSIVWHYRKADPHFAENQAKALIASLQQLLQNTAYVPYSGKKIVEVRHRLANKGRSLEYVLKQFGWQEQDSILTIGDDITDEDMYRIRPEKNISIHVGQPHFKAKHYLYSTDDVSVFFEDLENALADC
ncbi:MAG: bifunctional alpha,alpha-trehalose-phosphate synthase (UDP-forming)/trehalose-phosphatase [Oligoflexales bacterium]|nr:bifunctional alpha,alpha-trehalose-phosphate synthase (UDP-forming)/trehalose-phosphatase [Oligoflexales bacterium]